MSQNQVCSEQDQHTFLSVNQPMCVLPTRTKYIYIQLCSQEWTHFFLDFVAERLILNKNMF